MKKPKISVIVPVYNAEKFLNQCIDSIVNQELKEIEIICVNDGSTDDSLNILKEYQKKYNNIKVIEQKNSGVIAARVNGLKTATGEYVAWVDSDDFIEKNMYQRMYNLAHLNNLDIVICNYNFYPNNRTNKQKWFKKYKGKIDYTFIQQNTVLWNKIVKKTLIDKLKVVELFDNIGESTYALLLINANKVETIDECLYNYRVGHSSLSSNFMKIQWFITVVQHQIAKLEYVKKHEYDSKWIELFTYTYLYYSCILMVVGAFNGRKDIYEKYKEIIMNNNLFSKRYNKYIKNDISPLKIFFLKYIAINNYYATRVISKIML